MSSANEQTTLVVVTHSNYFWFNMTHQEASDIMRCWYSWREHVRLRAEGWEESEQWLKFGTLAGNVVGKSGSVEEGLDICVRAVGWEHVIGMYTRAVEPTPQERGVAALEKANAIMEQQLKDQQHGEEWKDRKGKCDAD